MSKNASYSPSISLIHLRDGSSISLNSGSTTFVVGPNNGGKSTFLREIIVDYHVSEVNKSKWIDKVECNLGSKQDFTGFLSDRFIDENSSFAKDVVTGATVLKQYTTDFYESYRLGHPDYLIKILNAENRIQLSNQTISPDVIKGSVLHPYHVFFFDPDMEYNFSDKVNAAFGKNVRINRTGSHTTAYLGNISSHPRLSAEYEQHIIQNMLPISTFGDGIRSYVGILLNFSADPRPVTVIDEPEAFLHPPQAFRLGKEIAELATSQNRQAIIATHSSDLIKGALSAEAANVQFVYLDHSRPKKYHVVDSSAVAAFGREPFLVHTDALDALFYSTTVICEADADIMFFKWALSKSPTLSLDEIFWIPSYGKSAVPGILRSMIALGVSAKCVFDIDVLLSRNIIDEVCSLLKIDISGYKSFLDRLPTTIKIPPVTETLTKISDAVNLVQEDDDDQSRSNIIRTVKKISEGLSKSWSLKATGLRLLPKGHDQSQARSLIDHLAKNGVLILQEGEIENYAPEIGGHGRSWVKQLIDQDTLDEQMSGSLKKQFSLLLHSQS
ncbi:putative AbiEii toxin of type IV toxin-antitoxin system [Sphingomonas sp. PP-CE-1A-559]|uniref:ATP-dependent nuclease n=1 Tax=Sphingomonas sp. PP-CE-1A-559 TaxID=2135657 RepID=UPI0010DEB3B0|nr:AAA family ATPase [Sphingomonas sp. PP-CE-1A-559]TCP93784.1 putative AbiEii toxin of type IV toxin-antitoxin system [Sphingomonas sp. PP-CE-1A-559]